MLFDCSLFSAARQLTYNSAAEDTTLMSLIERVPEEFWAGRLCLKLLVERLKADSSQFWMYLQSLPRGVPGVPIFFNETAIDALQYPPVIEQVRRTGTMDISFSDA